MNTAKYNNFAFISYSHRDMSTAKWLQRRLEGFRLPTEVHNDIEAWEKYLRPIFRDQSDLNTGILGEELRRHLEASKYLILICSEHSARSEWVSNEAKAFVEMGRLDRIIPVIIPSKGIPERDLFPAYLRDYFAENPDSELLGVNIGEVGKEKALIRVVSRMLGISFDNLWKRHERMRRRRIASFSIGTLALLAAAYIFAVPVKLDIHLDIQKADLPAEPDLSVWVDGNEYMTTYDDPVLRPIYIPGYNRCSDLRVATDMPFFIPTDTMIRCGLGLKKNLRIEMKRDDTFGIFAGHVYDADLNPIEGAIVTVTTHTTTTDAEGQFRIFIPLSEQREEQPIEITKAGYKPTSRPDETPGTDLKFIMHRN